MDVGMVPAVALVRILPVTVVMAFEFILHEGQGLVPSLAIAAT
jgi:hypothetical protein